VYISQYCWLVRVPPIFMKFGIRGHLTDVITCVKIFSWSVQGLRSSDTPKIAIFHWLAASPLQQCTHYRATLWLGKQTFSVQDSCHLFVGYEVCKLFLLSVGWSIGPLWTCAECPDSSFLLSNCLWYMYT